MNQIKQCNGSLLGTLNPLNWLFPTYYITHTTHRQVAVSEHCLCPPGVQTIFLRRYCVCATSSRSTRSQKYRTEMGHKVLIFFQTTIIKELTVQCGFDSLLLFASCHLCPLVDWNSRLNGEKMGCILFSVDSLFVFVFFVSSRFIYFFLILFWFREGMRGKFCIDKIFKIFCCQVVEYFHVIHGITRVLV